MDSLIAAVDASRGQRRGLEVAIRDQVRTGVLAASTTMPSSRRLATDLGWSRATVVAAYEQLVAEGYLIARHGAGTEVAAVRQPTIAATPSPLGPSYPFDFRPGEPDADAFPRAAWLRSVRSVIADAPAELFGYGDPRGRIELRTALSRSLGRSRSVVASAESVSVFAGFSSALGFLGEVLRRRGVRRVAVEDPTFFVNRHVLRSVGLNVVPVAVDGEGIDVDALTAADVGAVVVTPAHQYPLGMTMSPERRAELVGWARAADGWIIEDDYDGEFRYDRRPVGALQGLDPDRVIYAGTASKSFAAGVRLAWAVVPTELRSDLTMAKSLRAGVSSIDQAAFADFLERGAFARHLRSMRTTYHRRQIELVDRLRDEFDWIDVPPVEAGLHIACEFDARVDEAMLVAAADACGVGLMGLGRHYAGQPDRTGLVLGYSRLADHAFPHALERLVETLSRAP